MLDAIHTVGDDLDHTDPLHEKRLNRNEDTRMKETERIKNLCETALFIAIVFLGVFIIKFPGPFGYMHIGDSMIFLSVLMLGGKRGAVAGGLVMGAMIKHHAFGLNGRVLWIISAVAGGLTQGVGYVIFWYFLFGKAAAIAAVPGLAFQAVSGIIIAFVISEALQKTSLRRHFTYSTDGKTTA